MKVSYNEDGTIMYVEGPTEHGGVLTKMEMFDAQDKPSIMRHATHARCTEFDDKGNIVAQGKASMRWDGDNYDPGIDRSKQSKDSVS